MTATAVTSAVQSVQNPRVAQIESWLEQFDQCKSEAQRLMQGLAPEDLNWNPAEGSWSIGECFAHLNITATLYLPALDAALEKGCQARRGDCDPISRGWLGSFLARSQEPPVKRRFKAPQRFAPTKNFDQRQLLDEFLRLNEELAARARRTGSIELTGVTVISPVSPLIRITVADAFNLILAHQRRHFWQARDVKNAKLSNR